MFPKFQNMKLLQHLPLLVILNLFLISFSMESEFHEPIFRTQLQMPNTVRLNLYANLPHYFEIHPGLRDYLLTEGPDGLEAQQYHQVLKGIEIFEYYIIEHCVAIQKCIEQFYPAFQTIRPTEFNEYTSRADIKILSENKLLVFSRNHRFNNVIDCVPLSPLCANAIAIFKFYQS